MAVMAKVPMRDFNFIIVRCIAPADAGGVRYSQMACPHGNGP